MRNLAGIFMSKKNAATGSAHHTLKEQLSATAKAGFLNIPAPEKIPYNKPSMSPEDHLALLERRGLIIPDKGRALHYLTFIGYFRLSGYARHFRQDGSEDFNQGTTFDNVFMLYKFDRKLRILILDVLKRVEIATRAVISNHMSQKYGPHWFMEPVHFRSAVDHTSMLEEIQKNVNKHIQDSPVAHYYCKYNEPELPPSWVICEIMSIGFWSKVYENIKTREDKTAIASKFGHKPPVMTSFLHCLAALRNICAHHGRVWNKTFGVKPIKHRDYPEIFRRNDTLYAQLAVLNLFTIIIADGSSWKVRLTALMEENPFASLLSMGFPANWKTNTFWGLP